MVINNKIIPNYIIFAIIYFIFFAAIYISLIISYQFNYENDSGSFKNFYYIYSYIGNEYKIYSKYNAQELYNKLTREIRKDPTAMYGKKETGYMSRKYNDSLEHALTTGRGRMGFYEGTGKGPRYYGTSFLIPYKNEKLHLVGDIFSPRCNHVYFKYQNKVIYQFTIFDTKPLTLVVYRARNIEELRIRYNLDRCFEKKYLGKVCLYDRKDLRNCFFFFSQWALYNIGYVFLWWIILTFTINIIERSIKRHRLRKLEDN